MPLFESIVVFENYPAVRSVQNREEDLEIVKFTSFYKTNYPSVIGYPSSELVIGINTIAVALTPAQLPGYCGILRYCSKA